ncbi:MAG: dicarboxylate/amino acid:cation symporter [Bacteroidia bacterium]
MPKLALHWKILIGLFLGIIWGLVSSQLGWSSFTIDWIKPFGTIFINLLKLIAVPLVIVSLIDGISNLKDISQLSKMGGKTIALYISTTIIAISIGLLLVNILQPGKSIEESKRIELQQSFAAKASEKIEVAASVSKRGPLQPLIDIVPDNLFGAMSDNTRMLQVIFFAMLFGIAMVLLPENKTAPIKSFFNSINEVILKMVDIIMLAAPYGVFALLASLEADISMLKALGVYSITVVLGLVLMICLIYPIYLKIFTKRSIKDFFKGILPAQTLAFSTSSSAATLPVTLECCEKNLKLKEETSGFVLPLGATINMDGTSLYQAVAAVFIAQVYGMELNLPQQLTIVLTATLASIGAAPVPGAGMVMLVIILQSVGINPEGLALIFAVDRILDMCRTVTNVTSDIMVATIVDSKS